jgi:hypothetical protein
MLFVSRRHDEKRKKRKKFRNKKIRIIDKDPTGGKLLHV